MADRLDIEITQGSSFSLTLETTEEDYLNPRGTWTELANYETDDVVEYKNNLYKCILDASNSELPTNTTYYGSADAYPYNLCTFAAKIRTDYSEETSVVDFTIVPVTDYTDGKLKLTLTAAQTAALDFKNAVYDLEVTRGTDVWKEVSGKVTIVNEATK